MPAGADISEHSTRCVHTGFTPAWHEAARAVAHPQLQACCHDADAARWTCLCCRRNAVDGVTSTLTADIGHVLPGKRQGY
jgi:hypothetical protein